MCADDVNAAGNECPYALKAIAIQLLLEISTYLRETFHTLPRVGYLSGSRRPQRYSHPKRPSQTHLLQLHDYRRGGGQSGGSSAHDSSRERTCRRGSTNRRPSGGMASPDRSSGASRSSISDPAPALEKDSSSASGQQVVSPASPKNRSSTVVSAAAAGAPPDVEPPPRHTLLRTSSQVDISNELLQINFSIYSVLTIFGTQHDTGQCV